MTTCQIDTLLAADCAYPIANGPTYRDGLEESEARGAALKECTGRMRVIREACAPNTE